MVEEDLKAKIDKLMSAHQQYVHKGGEAADNIAHGAVFKLKGLDSTDIELKGDDKEKWAKEAAGRLKQYGLQMLGLVKGDADLSKMMDSELYENLLQQYLGHNTESLTKYAREKDAITHNERREIARDIESAANRAYQQLVVTKIRNEDVAEAKPLIKPHLQGLGLDADKVLKHVYTGQELAQELLRTSATRYQVQAQVGQYGQPKAA